MCGISGWIFENSAQADTAVHVAAAYMKASLDAMIHRGPDSGGFAEVSYGVIGARRLAIIDVEGGDQPVFNEDGSVVAVLNGEIYNFLELRRALEACGHRFKTRTDTEVLVHGYEEWGTGLPDHLEGMFAFAVWDDVAKTLFLARDRLGKKPLFYTEAAGGFRFASEIKALLADGAAHPGPEWKSLLGFLTLQHLPPPLTPLKGISQLSPGESLLYRDGRPQTQRYWDLIESAARSAESPTADPRPARALERIQEAAVERTRADVPVGIFLSGGIDSSLVAAALYRAGHPLKTFSVGFADSRYDESGRARAVAHHLGSDHTEMVVEAPTAAEIGELVWHLDEPLADSSAIPQFLICKAAASQLKVVISGDGGDEFFGGYLKHHGFARAARLLAAGSVVPPGFARLTRRLADRAESGGLPLLTRPVARRLRRAARALGISKLEEVDAYFDFLAPVPSFERHRAAGEALIEAVGAGEVDSPVSRLVDGVRRCPEGLGLLWRLGVVDALTELPGDILVKVDRMSMANSLEVRSPLLDRRLVEWALSLPDRARGRRGETKPLLRDAARMLLPPEVAAAPKQGFGVPMSEWMRADLGAVTADVLLDPKTAERGWIDPEYAKALLSENLAGYDMGPRLWQLLVLELWARSYIDSSPPAPVGL